MVVGSELRTNQRMRYRTGELPSPGSSPSKQSGAGGRAQVSMRGKLTVAFIVLLALAVAGVAWVSKHSQHNELRQNREMAEEPAAVLPDWRIPNSPHAREVAQESRNEKVNEGQDFLLASGEGRHDSIPR